MKSKNDVRVKKTLENLNRVFKEMLSEKFFENITVNDICERAGIRRATFYNHFNDKYDFLAHYTRSLRREFAKSNAAVAAPDNTMRYFIEYAKEFINFLDENEAFVNNVLGSSVSASIISVIIQENLSDTAKILSKSEEMGLKLPASVDTLSNVLTGGVATAIISWCINGKPISKNQLLSELEAIINVANIS